MRVAACILLCGAALLISSCKSKAKPTIIGKWKSDAGNWTEFHEDGKFTTSGGNLRKYNLPDEKTIGLADAKGEPVTTWKIVSLTEKELTVTTPDGQKTTFRR